MGDTEIRRLSMLILAVAVLSELCALRFCASASYVQMTRRSFQAVFAFLFVIGSYHSVSGGSVRALVAFLWR